MREKAMELDELLRCPVDWDADTLTEISDWSVLRLDWLFCLDERMPEGGGIPMWPDERDELLEDPNSYELDQLLANLRLRRSDAEQLYETRARRLAGFTFLTPEEQHKHFRGTLPRKDIAPATKRAGGGAKRRPSLFLENHSSEQLKKTFWTWFGDYFDSELADESAGYVVDPASVYRDLIEPDGTLFLTPMGRLWRDFMSRKSLRISMGVLRDVGGCDGRLTSFLCYDVHIEDRTVHCFPVSEVEAKEIMGEGKVLSNDSLDC